MRKRITGRWQQRGQALILAVIIMLLLAFMAAGLVVLVSGGIDSTVRDEQKVRARWLAEAGIRYADDQLSNSTLGADWRPTVPAAIDPRAGAAFDQPTYDLTWDSFEILRGWDTQSVADQTPATQTPVYYLKCRFQMEPDAPSTVQETPDDPSQDFVDPAVPVTPILNAEETAPHDHFLVRVEYAPNPSDPLSKYLKITAIGRPGNSLTAFHELVAYKPLALTDYLLFVHDRQRDASTATLGQPAIDVNGDGSTASTGRAAYGSAQDWEASGANDFIPLILRGPVRSNKSLQVLAPLRFDTLQHNAGVGNPAWQEKVEIAGTLSSVVDDAARPGGSVTGNSEVLVSNVAGGTPGLTVYSDNNAAAVNSTQGTTPSGAAWPSQLEVGAARDIEAPALESYEEATGVARWDRLTKYSGEEQTVGGTVLNTGELGFGRGIYLDNAEQRDNFTTAANSWLRPETWGGRQFLPRGALVELYAHYPDELNVNQPPAIVITRTDGSTWTDPTSGASTGSRTQVFNFPNKGAAGTWAVWNGANGWPTPQNGVLLCEGNIRIRGRLPRSDQGSGLDYNLTVISRGNIYVEGPLLRPSDYSAAISELHVDNTRIALLARDNVVINPTALAPGALPGLPPAPFTRPSEAPDDAHWVLDPNGTQALGLTAPVCRRPDDGAGIGSLAYGRRVTVIDADGNVNDGLNAAIAIQLAKTRQVLGLQPATAPNTNVATQPWLANYGPPGRPGAYSLDGTAPNLLRSAGVPVFFADWRNLGQALYPCGAGGVNRMEYFPDSRFLDDTNWNLNPGAEELGVPSYVALSGGIDLASGGVAESRSDVLVKNAKIENMAGGDDGQMPRPGLELRVSALLFAERGTFFVIPGDWFDPRVDSAAALADGVNPTATTPDLAAAKFARLRRFNYRVAIHGALIVNTLPSLMEVGEWTDKWCYPSDVVRDNGDALVASTLSGQAVFNDYDAVKYTYDWGLRSSARANLPRFPALPASPGVIHLGEENKR